jgi:SAM-dependent methyltransferase
MSVAGTDMPQQKLEPSPFLVEHLDFLLERPLPGPVLDMACGEGHNGLFLASGGLRVTLLDRSRESLARARRLAQGLHLDADFKTTDLENSSVPPLETDHYGCILVFRYLHRPLFPWIRAAVKSGGCVLYETFTTEQPRFGRPKNPDYLLKPAELAGYFRDWEILFSFEGILHDPSRAVAQLICRKP